jgi:hypothetical protein
MRGNVGNAFVVDVDRAVVAQTIWRRAGYVRLSSSLPYSLRYRNLKPLLLMFGDVSSPIAHLISFEMLHLVDTV